MRVEGAVFVVDLNHEVIAFDGVGEAEAFFCRYEDSTAEGGRAWDQGGVPLEPRRTSVDRIEFLRSAVAHEPEVLRTHLIQALNRTTTKVPADTPLADVVEMSRTEFRVAVVASPLSVIVM